MDRKEYEEGLKAIVHNLDLLVNARRINRSQYEEMVEEEKRLVAAKSEYCRELCLTYNLQYWQIAILLGTSKNNAYHFCKRQTWFVERNKKGTDE